MKRPSPSLQARALTWLAQREQSRSELRRKLLRVLQVQLQVQGRGQAADPDLDPDRDQALAVDAHGTFDNPDQKVEQLLDELQSKGLLSEARFVESRVRARAASQGARRIEMELAQHGLKLEAQALQQLRDSELQRAKQLWRRKFGGPAEDARSMARQMRFLAGRGFTGEVIRRVVAGSAALQDDDPQPV